MNHPENQQDMARAAATVRLAGELMESSAIRALHVTDSWKTGPRSPNLDPNAGGWRYEVIGHIDGTIEVVPIPGDPTGEAALDTDQLATEHDHLTAALAATIASATEVVRLVRHAVPNPLTALRPDDLTNAQVSAAGWCISCWRDGTYHEPVAMRPNGERRYRDYCLWCGEFKAGTTIEPPLELVEARHRGQRITAQMVDTALAKVANARRQAKADRKKNRKRKAA